MTNVAPSPDRLLGVRLIGLVVFVILYGCFPPPWEEYRRTLDDDDAQGDDDAGDDDTTPVEGPAIRVDPAHWDFGELAVGCDDQVDVTVSSVGTEALTIIGLSWMADPSYTALSWSTTMYDGMHIPPNGQESIRIVFAPEELEEYTGLLTVESDDPAEPFATSGQVGTGVADQWRNQHHEQGAMNWTDILWVVDNSASMSEEQGWLGDDASYLTSALNSAGVDFRIATVTTDNASFQSAGGSAVIDSTTPNAANVFAANVNVGTNGSGTERGLLFGWDAVEQARNGISPNTGWWRDSAGLRVVFVSDEEDQSGDTSTYISNFVNTKATPDQVVLSAICGTNGKIAMGCNGPGGSAEAGAGYVDAALQTGGMLASICDTDWSQALTTLGWQALNVVDTYPLEYPAIPNSISVSVNSQALYQGWSFDPAIGDYGAVVLEPDYLPEEGDTIDISYGSPGDCGS